MNSYERVRRLLLELLKSFLHIGYVVEGVLLGLENARNPSTNCLANLYRYMYLQLMNPRSHWLHLGIYGTSLCHPSRFAISSSTMKSTANLQA